MGSMSMHWVWPIQVLLLAAVLVPALAWLGWHAARRRRQALAQWGGTATEAWTTAISLPRRFLREAALAAAWVLVLAALARPQYGTATSATELGGTVVLAIDASASMRAADVSPSRLALARQWALDLAAQLPGCRLGLIVFAGEAQVLCPPTEDHAIFRDLLGGLEGASAGREGSELGPTLGLGRELLGRVGGGVLVVVTDGEYHDPDPGAALEGRPRGALDLVTVTVGGSVPVPVLGPTPGGVVVDPRHGGTALTAARPGAMGELARAAGGLAIAASSPGTGSATAVRFIETRLAARAAPTTSVQRGERYQWPLGLALLLLILRLATREGTGRAPAAARNLGAALSLVLILCLRASGAGDAGVARRQPAGPRPRPGSLPLQPGSGAAGGRTRGRGAAHLRRRFGAARQRARRPGPLPEQPRSPGPWGGTGPGGARGGRGAGRTRPGSGGPA
jgi:Ca-activated chloride channel family protein